ncbi:hypothetical protein ACA910_008710 [Epithemia clementina (nom. ined.)]
MTGIFRQYTNVSERDILCTKDRAVCNHPGNRIFRSKIEGMAVEYGKAASALQKTEITRRIIQDLKQTHGCRFLGYDEDNDSWSEISSRLVRDKVSHALRFAIRRRHKKKQKTAANSKTTSQPSTISKGNELAPSSNKGIINTFSSRESGQKECTQKKLNCSIFVRGAKQGIFPRVKVTHIRKPTTLDPRCSSDRVVERVPSSWNESPYSNRYNEFHKSSPYYPTTPAYAYETQPPAYYWPHVAQPRPSHHLYYSPPQQRPSIQSNYIMSSTARTISHDDDDDDQAETLYKEKVTPKEVPSSYYYGTYSTRRLEEEEEEEEICRRVRGNSSSPCSASSSGCSSSSSGYSVVVEEEDYDLSLNTATMEEWDWLKDEDVADTISADDFANWSKQDVDFLMNETGLFSHADVPKPPKDCVQGTIKV